MVTPAGQRQSRAAVVESVRESGGREEPGAFDIEIRNVEIREQAGEYATVRYEEHQVRQSERTGRISTVGFRADDAAPGGVVWVDLQETWLD